MTISTEKPSRSADLRVARILVAVVSSTMIALGMYSLVSEYYYGASSKNGGAEVSLYGGDAQVAGLLLIALGALPLALWFSTARTAAWWGAIWAAAFLVLLVLWLYG